MKIIDCHTHFYPRFAAENPEGWAAGAREPYWGALVGRRADGKRSLQGFPNGKKFLLDMDRAGVERAVVQGWYWENPETCSLMNAEIAKFAAAHPDRISAFASINPAFPRESLKEISRARDLGFIGVGELHDGVQGFDYSSREFSEIALACAGAGLAVCAHLTEKSARQYPGKRATDFESAYAAARACPSAKFIFAHLCGGDAAAPSFEPPPNAFFDTAAFPLTDGADAVAKAVKKFPDRALYGSDYPLRLYPRKFISEEMETVVSEAKAAAPAEFAQSFFRKLRVAIRAVTLAGCNLRFSARAALRIQIPKNPREFSRTASARYSSETPKISAAARAISGMLAGSLTLPRSGTGARYGQSVSSISRPRPCASIALRISPALL